MKIYQVVTPDIPDITSLMFPDELAHYVMLRLCSVLPAGLGRRFSSKRLVLTGCMLLGILLYYYRSHIANARPKLRTLLR